MRQAIEVKVIPATTTKDTRLKASCQAGYRVVPWDDDLERDENHKAAAFNLASDLGWPKEFVGGWLPNGNSVWVFSDK